MEIKIDPITSDDELVDLIGKTSQTDLSIIEAQIRFWLDDEGVGREAVALLKNYVSASYTQWALSVAEELEIEDPLIMMMVQLTAQSNAATNIFANFARIQKEINDGQDE